MSERRNGCSGDVAHSAGERRCDFGAGGFAGRPRRMRLSFSRVSVECVNPRMRFACSSRAAGVQRSKFCLVNVSRWPGLAQRRAFAADLAARWQVAHRPAGPVPCGRSKPQRHGVALTQIRSAVVTCSAGTHPRSVLIRWPYVTVTPRRARPAKAIRTARPSYRLAATARTRQKRSR